MISFFFATFFLSISFTIDKTHLLNFSLTLNDNKVIGHIEQTFEKYNSSLFRKEFLFANQGITKDNFIFYHQIKQNALYKVDIQKIRDTPIKNDLKGPSPDVKLINKLFQSVSKTEQLHESGLNYLSFQTHRAPTLGETQRVTLLMLSGHLNSKALKRIIFNETINEEFIKKYSLTGSDLISLENEFYLGVKFTAQKSHFWLFNIFVETKHPNAMNQLLLNFSQELRLRTTQSLSTEFNQLISRSQIMMKEKIKAFNLQALSFGEELKYGNKALVKATQQELDLLNNKISDLFTVKIIKNPLTPNVPTKPSPLIFFFFGACLGLTIGFLVVLLSAIPPTNYKQQ